MQEDQYEEIYEKVRTALQDLPEELQGELHLLEALDASRKLELTEGHYLFKECDRFLDEAQANRFFPAGRAIFLNEAKTFVVWVNEEDHLRIISMQDGADIAQVYQRFITALETLGNQIPFQRDERLGYLTFCPTNLGTAIRASVHIRLPKLGSDKTRLEEAAATHKLQIRGVHGEHTDTDDGVLDVSNKRRLGLTEIEAVKEMVDGVKALIELEKELEAGGGEVTEEAAAAEE
uniref:arginine kinase n=1 Tax=Anopheles maculatus TaxID=74869 RepID=A0A182S8D4_9DIPT